MSRFLLLSLMVLALAMTLGCPMKNPQAPPAADPSRQPSTQPAAPVSSETKNATPPRQIVEETIALPPATAVTLAPLTPLEKPASGTLQIVPFAYDQHLLSEEARTIIAANALILKASPRVKIQLSGHCDERGSDQYNIALGERRAEAVRSYLLELGINPGRMETVSFGEEEPIDAGHDESAWIKNRRVEFTLLP